MRRLIFNDDGGGSRIPRYLVRTQQEFLEQRASGLDGSAVDTISFCTTAGTFGRFYHRSEVGETAADVRVLGWEAVGGGLVTTLIRGDVAAVRAATEAGSVASASVGEVVAVHVIPRPHPSLASILPRGASGSGD